MRHYCTYFDANYLNRGLTLYESLCTHGGEFSLTILCMDDATVATLRARALPGVHLLPLANLMAAHAPLASARSDRTALEFYFTCTSWLMRHLLPNLPHGELLTYLDADMYFFASPEKVFSEIGTGSVAITPHRFPASLAHLARYGRYNVGWVSFRHDETGLACAADWSERCAAWCFNRLEGDRYADQKYLDAWPDRYPGTVSLVQAGVNAAPWNVKDSAFAPSPSGPLINGAPLIFYHFHALVHLGEHLFDPSLHKYDAELTDGLRHLVYLPYLRALLREEPAAAPADLIPPMRPDDLRAGLALPHLLARLAASELDRAVRLSAIEENRAATEQAVSYLRLVEKDRAQARADLEHNTACLRAVQADNEERLKSILFYQEKLKTAYDDHERNMKYLRMLEAEIQAHLKVQTDKDTIIADLAARLQAATQPR